MKRILFVDDEPSVLSGLRRSLRIYSDRWEMFFANSGREALELIEHKPVDVIVTDMRMPEMDGAQLLTVLHHRFPRVTRIILSGYSELEATIRAARVAHQFLAKPCEPKLLYETIDRACALESLLQQPELIQAAGEVTALPSCPKTYFALKEAMADPNATAKSLATIVQRDIAMSAKILHLANSSFFGLPRRVVDVAAAVQYLGCNTLSNLVLSAEAFQALENVRLPNGFSFENLQHHAFLTAGIAQGLMDEKFSAYDAFTAGMLHDIGLLVLAARQPGKFTQVFEESSATGRPLHAVERERMGVSHAEVGAYLLGLWGLPYSIIEAVANHHEPGRVVHDKFAIVDAVHAASALAFEFGPSNGLEPLRVQLDGALFASLGIDSEKITTWRQHAESLAKVQTEF